MKAPIKLHNLKRSVDSSPWIYQQKSTTFLWLSSALMNTYDIVDVLYWWFITSPAPSYALSQQQKVLNFTTIHSIPPGYERQATALALSMLYASLLSPKKTIKPSLLHTSLRKLANPFFLASRYSGANLTNCFSRVSSFHLTIIRIQ